MDDDEAARHYSDPENLRPAGPARRRSGAPALSGHVPVRFSPSLISAIKALADFDGVSVSAWIRNWSSGDRATFPPVTTVGDEIVAKWELLYKQNEVGKTSKWRRQVAFG